MANVKYDFTDKVAVVVGGADGMGKATTQMLAESGAKVLIADFNQEKGKTFAAELRNQGYTAEFTYCDARNRESDFAVIDKAVELWGRIDYCANVVGISGKNLAGAFYDHEDANFDNVMMTNVNGHRWLLQAETRQMTKQGGDGYAIVEVASMQGLVGTAGASEYTASKHAMVGMVKALGAEFAKQGIRINAIAPVATATGFVKGAYEQMGVEFTNKTDRVPRGYMLEPEECANAIMWLLSDGASAINATTIQVDGGASSVR